MADDLAIENALHDCQNSRLVKVGADQERDKISRWLRAKSQNLHAVSVTNPVSNIGRKFCAKMLVQIAAEIEAGGGSDFTPRDTSN